VLAALSLQPQNRPGVSQVAVMDAVSVHPDVGASVAVVVVVVVVVAAVVVVLSLQPNQPGVLHVEVVVAVVVVVDVVDVVAVVLSSRQPHQPGVLQVVVRVRVFVETDVGEAIVELCVPLPQYMFQRLQSLHSGAGRHSGTVSYFIRTSWMTARILWVPIPTRQPLSATTS